MEESLRLALVAATCDDVDVEAAMDRYLRVRRTAIQPKSEALLPLLYRRLEAVNAEHEDLQHLAGRYRRTVEDNRRLLDRAEPVLRQLTSIGCPNLLNGVAAMASSHQRDDIGIAPITSLAILIDASFAGRVVDWMVANGWRVEESFGWGLDEYLAAHHEVRLLFGDDGAIRLRLGLSAHHHAALDAALVRTGVPAALDGREVRVLPSSGQVLHGLCEPLASQPVQLVATLNGIRRGEVVDWSWVCSQLVERRITTTALEALAEVSALDEGAVPEWVVHRLRSGKRHWSDWSSQGRSTWSADGPRIFAARWSQRSRGRGPLAKLQIARLLAGQSARRAGIGSLRDARAVASRLRDGRRGRLTEYYQELDKGHFDYDVFRLPAIDRPVRGPKVDLSRPYVAFAGAAQTFGRFCDKPFPALLAERLGVQALNLGAGGAGPRTFERPPYIDLFRNADLVVMQVLSGRSEGNSWFDNSAFGDLRGVRVSDGMPMRFNHFFRELVQSEKPDLVQRVVDETRQNYVNRMSDLLRRIEVPTILFWMSMRAPDFDDEPGSADGYLRGFPHLVNRSMIDELRVHADAYVECVSTEGIPQRLWPADEPVGDAPLEDGHLWNLYYPSPSMHVLAADALDPVCRRLLG